ncbi:MAG: 7-cyano-7-deazaguanine synthase QueC [candidate division WOR-3 bacterium]|nr:MAG: 7-cyano-7-deazaguanine synthase QueC [candidate division WOR-3 bacterium]
MRSRTRKTKSIILLSGGLDSTVSAAIAVKRTQPLFALTFDYGQRAATMEIASAKKISDRMCLQHRVIALPFFKEFKNCTLIKHGKKATRQSFTRLKDVWVPNRNGLFINLAACFAEYYGAGLIITGFNREEAQEFPDNTVVFMNAVNNAFRFSTLGKIKVKSYVAAYTKKEIYGLGMKIDAPLDLIYSCYLGGKTMCGKCASCKRYLKSKRAHEV